MTIDLKTGTQYAPHPEDYMTRSTAVAPDGTGDCPQWRFFVDRITGGDPDLQAYLQRACGYCLTGSTKEHAMFFVYGTGANGKSVFINTLTSIMGDYATTASMETFVEARGERHPTELAMLDGPRLVVAVETEEGRRWNESRIKALTGGDTIAARYMRGDFFQYTPKFKLMIAGNHKPHLRNIDEAIRRRLHLIPFSVTIPEAERDKNLQDKLKAEWPGILQWAIDGSLEWRKQGLNPPASVIAATDEYIAAEDTFGCWLEEALEPADASAVTPTADLFAAWKIWAERRSEFAGSTKRFAQMLQARGYAPKREARQRGFSGIRLRRTSHIDSSHRGQM